MFTNPSQDDIRTLLQRVRRIAVVGLSPKPDRPSHYVSKAMQAWGYEIVPVRPGLREALGVPAYARLEDVPGKVDLVNVFRNANEVDAVVDSAVAIDAPAIWIQQGIINDEAATRAQAAGLFTVMDRCIMVDYRRLLA